MNNINNSTPIITVFTPTYNRAHTINRTYSSLVLQTDKDFEWLIIDDGSIDNTESVINSFIIEKKINIRYIKKENGGKHTAWNLAIDMSLGQFMIILDADDLLPNYAIERFIYFYLGVKDNPKIAGITALCSDFNGNIIGVKYPKNGLQGKPLEINNKYNISGDKCGGYILDKVRKIKFPIFENERFITEGIIINRISQDFDNIFINEILCCVEYQVGGLSDNSLKLRVENPIGATLYYKEAFLYNSYNLKTKIKNLINFLRFRMHRIGSNLRTEDNLTYLFIILFSPIAYFIYLRDKWKIKK